MPNDQLVSTPNRASEHLWTLDRSGHTIHCELKDDGEYGIQANVRRNGELWFSLRFSRRAHAVEWADAERVRLERAPSDARAT